MAVEPRKTRVSTGSFSRNVHVCYDSAVNVYVSTIPSWEGTPDSLARFSSAVIKRIVDLLYLSLINVAPVEMNHSVNHQFIFSI